MSATAGQKTPHPRGLFFTGTPGAWVATVVAALPQDLASRVDHVAVETVDQITLVMRDQREVLWGSAEESALKAEVVDKLLAAQEASYYDVSVPGNPTYRP